MKQAICPQEAAAARAARTGQWEESLQAHVAECAVCRDVAQAARWMYALAHKSERNLALPDADLLWWRAQLAQKQAQAERAQKPLEWVAVFSEAILVLGPAGWFAWNWHEVQGLLTGLLAGLVLQVWKVAWLVATFIPTFFPR